MKLTINQRDIPPSLITRVSPFAESPQTHELTLWDRQPLKHQIGREAATWGVELSIRTPPYPLTDAEELLGFLIEVERESHSPDNPQGVPIAYEDANRDGDYLITLEVEDIRRSAGFRSILVKLEFWGTTEPKDRSEPPTGVSATNFESPWGSSFA